MNQIAKLNDARQVDPLISLVERVIHDPSIEIDRLERILEMAERRERQLSEQAFNEAMSAVQAEMEPVRVDSSNPQTRSRYASYDAIDQAIRPIYTRHGFGLTFNTSDAKGENEVRILCHVTHGSFTRIYHIDMPTDGKGVRGTDVMTKTHAMGSATTYGRRYLLSMIFNISTTTDDDGNAAGGRYRREEPVQQQAQPRTNHKPSVPHTIQPVKGDTYETWSKKYIAVIDAIEGNASMIDRWHNENAVTLEKVCGGSPTAYAMILEAYERCKARLSASAPASPGVDGKGAGDANSTQSPAPKPAAVIKNPEVFRKAFIETLKSANNEDEADKLWERDVQPFYDGMFPPDQEDLVRALRIRKSELIA